MKIENVLVCSALLVLAVWPHFARADSGADWLDDKHPWREPADRHVDFSHLDLQVTPDLAKRTVSATATYKLTRKHQTERLRLDAVDLNLTEVVWLQSGAAVAAKWQPVDHGVVIEWPPTADRDLELRLRYNCAPRQGFYFVAADADAPNRPLHAWTQGETEEVRHWLPAPDQPDERMTWTVAVTAPTALVALSNGDPDGKPMIDKPTQLSLTRYRSTAPLPLYLLTVAIGPFVAVDHGHSKLPVVTWALADDVDNVRRAYAKLAKMVDVLGQRLGVAYPFSRYSQVVVHEFNFGGMENATLTTLTHRAVPDARAELDRPADGLLAHELGHQWFGDLVTCRSWADIWLNEGWASFADSLWHESEYGIDRYMEDLADSRRGYFEEANRYLRPVVADRAADPDDVFDSHTYSKGAWIAHMLRRKLGEEPFWRGVKTYLTRHRFGSVETDDLRRALEEASGLSLRGFFWRWLRQAGHPVLKVDLKWDDEAKMVRLGFAQTQRIERAMPPFTLAIEIALTAKQGAEPTLHRLVLDKVTDSFRLPAPTRPWLVEIDPRSAWLVDWTVEAATTDLAAMLERSAYADVRLRACTDLGRVLHEPTALAAILRAAQHDKARHVRAKATDLLGRGPRDKVIQPLVERLTKDSESQVRRAAARALGQLLSNKGWAALQVAARTDVSYAVQAAALQALVAIDRSQARAELLAAVARPSHQETVRAAALHGLATLADQQDWPLVVAAIESGQSKFIREAAAPSVAEFGARAMERKEDARLALEALLHEDSARIRRAAADALGILDNPKARQALLAAASREPLEKQREKLRQTAGRLGQQGPLTERLQRLEEEVQQLRRDTDKDRK
ncbi:MAG: hypothetical protein EXR77_02180 [Myxococcales bacterium]|nr:hypothetical protein [Myxococcales bacterium]